MGINFFHFVQTKKENGYINGEEWRNNIEYTNILNEFFYTKDFHKSIMAEFIDYKVEKYSDGSIFRPLYENDSYDSCKDLKYYEYCQIFNVVDMYNKIHLNWKEREENYNYEDYIEFRMFLHRLILDKEHYNMDIRIVVSTNFQ